MNLAPYIRELILLNECIILRRVGGFETSYKHATLDTKQHALKPPSKQIHFRADWIQDNGILEDHLCKALHINKDKASKLIDEYVDELYATLSSSGRYRMEGIGDFMMDDHQNISFSVFENENYLADSFGLDVLDIEAESPEVETPVQLLEPVEQPRRKLTGWYIVIGVLLLVISVTLIILLSQNGAQPLFRLGGKAEPTDEVITFGEPVAEKDSVTLKIEEELDEKTKPQQALSFSKEPAEGSNYYIVAGSFNTQRNAEIMQDQLLQEGFNAEIIISDTNYRVIVGRFTDRKQAINELRRLRQQLDRSVWLLTQ